MKLYQPIKVEILWNEAVHEHVEKSRGCQGKLMFDETGEKKVGLCWRERLKCSDCPYVSAMHKLYTEVSRPGKRGQKSVAPNLGVQVGLSHSSTGNSVLRNVLNAANIPSPAKSGMQRNTNRVAAHLVKVNQDDMSKICRDIGKINEAKGLPTDAAIRVEADARYNNPLYSGSGHTPFQPASQAVYTVCENTTPKKKIISISTINKLCQKCALNSKNSGDRKCDQCSANISSHQSIGDELTWAKQCLQDLDDKNVKVKYITTDCDSRAADAAQQMYEEARYTERPTQLKDTRHLGGSQRRMVKNAVFSAGMFPGKTKKIREQMQCRFAHDVRSRFAKEYTAAFQKYGHDRCRRERHLSGCIDTVVACCQGNHEHCKKKSLVCHGVLSEGRVWNYTYLPPKTRLTCTEDDVKTLRECILYRLCHKTIQATKFNTNTQKCESVNRAYSLRNPKNITMSRNFQARIHSAALEVNRGPGQAIAMQAEAVGAPIVPGSRVAKQLISCQSSCMNSREYKKTEQCRRSRCKRRINKYRLYDSKSNNELHYKTGLTDNVRKTCTKKSNVHTDHSYSK